MTISGLFIKHYPKITRSMGERTTAQRFGSQKQMEEWHTTES